MNEDPLISFRKKPLFCSAEKLNVIAVIKSRIKCHLGNLVIIAQVFNLLILITMKINHFNTNNTNAIITNKKSITKTLININVQGTSSKET